MKSFFCIAVVAPFLLASVSADNEKQVRVTDTQLWFANPRYINGLRYTVTNGNATYNNVKLHWDLKEDLPEDLRLLSRIYVTDKEGNNAKLVYVDRTYVCRESESRQFLPKVLIVDESELNTKCIKKGVYDLADMGQLRIEHVVPDLESKGNYYKVDYTLGTFFRTVLVATFYSEWGYSN